MASKHIPLGPFQLREPLGRGGMGEVWTGLHVPQRVPIAVKVMTQEGARKDAYRDAFRNEVRAVAALDHPAIIMPLDYGEMPPGAAEASEGRLVEGSPYIVMELARRGSLKKYISAIDWLEIKVVLFTILDALAHAHAHDVIHRDLKPANILVGCSGDPPGIKLTDFGLARALDTFCDTELLGEGWGTPNYMAPEQFRGQWRDYGPWTDLYSFGVMAYELTCGIQPFQATTSAGFAQAHALQPPARFQPRIVVPDGFEGWLLRLLQKVPEDRFQTAADASWNLQLLGDPPQTGGEHSTVKMLPVGSRDSPTSLTALPDQDRTSLFEPSILTADVQGLEVDSDPTMIDRPDTTRLIDSALNKLDTLNLSPKMSTDGFKAVEPVSEYEGAIASRTPPPLPYTWKRQEVQPHMKLLGAGLGLFGLRAIRLTGRERERDLLWTQLREVRQSGQPRCIVIKGASGTGKTRLAEWISRRAHEVGSGTPFRANHSRMNSSGDGLSTMMARRLRTLGLDPRATQERVEKQMKAVGLRDPIVWDAFAELVSVEHSDPDSRMNITRAEQRYGLIRNYIRACDDNRPAIVVLDDVQWGSDALNFANYLMDDSRDSLPALIVVTARTEALKDRPVEDAILDELISKDRVSFLQLEHLDETTFRKLVTQLLCLSENLAHHVARRCGGNPLFAIQLVGDWVARGDLRFGPRGFELRDGITPTIPDDIHELWLGRLERLEFNNPDAKWRALELAACLGRDVRDDEWSLAATMFGLEIPDTLQEKLLIGGLAKTNDGGWNFVHGMLRESLERRAREQGRWTRLNEACVRMLEARFPERGFPFAERMARHLFESGSFGDAVEYLEDSIVRRTNVSDFEQAAQHLRLHRLSLIELNRPKNDRSWGKHRLLEAEIHLQQGAFDEAQRLAEHLVIDARRHGWRNILPRALNSLGIARYSCGQLEHARGSFRRARELFSANNDLAGVARALRGLGRVHQHEGSYDQALKTLGEARDIFAESDDSLELARTLNALGDVSRAADDLDSAMNFSREALDLYEKTGNQIGVADCINDLAELGRLTGDLEAALNSCTHAMRLYEALGSDESMFVRINFGLILVRYARYSEARQVFEKLQQYFDRSNQLGLLAACFVYNLPNLAALTAWGDWDSSFEQAEELLERTRYHHPDMIWSLKLAQTIAVGTGEQRRAQQCAQLREKHAED